MKSFWANITAFFTGLFTGGSKSPVDPTPEPKNATEQPPAPASDPAAEPNNMTFITQVLDAGASKPFRFLHLSDTHLTFADSRDGDRKVQLAKSRTAFFPNSLPNLYAAMAKAEELGCFFVHTGDLIDFVSEKNLEIARDFTNRSDVFMAAGNHEFSLYVGEAKEDAAYRNQSLDKVQAVFKNDIRFDSRIVNGVNLVCLDNGYYLIEPWQLDRLEEELARGLPTILFLHTPLYAQDVYDYSIHSPSQPAYLMCVPEEKMRGYSPDRYEQQKEDAVTARAYKVITAAPNIKAIFAGHLHFDFHSMLTPVLPQYITDCETGRIVEVR